MSSFGLVFLFGDIPTIEKTLQSQNLQVKKKITKLERKPSKKHTDYCLQRHETHHEEESANALKSATQRCD